MFEDYLSELTDAERSALVALVDRVASVAPDATEGRSYGLPAFRYRGKPLIGFAAHKDHLGLYPFSPAILASVTERLDGYSHSKGSLRFSPEQPIPDDVLTDLVVGRMREIDGA
jgi:uncharacterized protein YdhG (YjbR/CyaY superfamily)